MWNARTKIDLIIEVWEKLDCENVGSAEIEAIETVVADRYGNAAVDSPMVIARLLADEGSDLRHSEIMRLYLERSAERPYDAALRNVLRISSLRSTLGSIRELENLRQKYRADCDKEGLRLVKETAISGKKSALERAQKFGADATKRMEDLEIAEWLTIWLQTPDVFEHWVDLRQRSGEFIDKFGHLGEN